VWTQSSDLAGKVSGQPLTSRVWQSTQSIKFKAEARYLVMCKTLQVIVQRGLFQACSFQH
jgi:hypothetical protein